MKLVVSTVLLTVSSLLPLRFSYAEAAEPTLTQQLAPFVRVISGQQSTFELTGDLQLKIDGRVQPISLRLSRYDDESFDLRLAHEEYAIDVIRRADSTILSLPLHKRVYRGTGAVTTDHLAPLGILSRLVSSQSEAGPFKAMVTLLQPGLIDPLLLLVEKPLRLKRDEVANAWLLTKDSPLKFDGDGTLVYEADFGRIELKVAETTSPELQTPVDADVVELPRAEIERTLCRGIHRATEILAPGTALRSPAQAEREVGNGRLMWIENQRVAVLHGSPEQIGRAHGELLKKEAMRCIESVLYSFGTAHVIRTGRWFRQDLEDAYARLEPHIPDRHKRETVALAEAIGLPAETLNVLNVFPELFHCSGFAVFDSSTVDGTLYHGRVLDYMTTIGLQDAATTFIVNPDDHHAFANIGYAAFIGSVSGMNTQEISLGEMGGGGEGQWDGVPMATLMRRALEECDTLDDVIDLWTNSPRTCEYYYVFADGKTNDAVGVAAYPDSIEFIKPGQAHERLGSGIKDAVVLSAGSRLEELRKRVTEKRGHIDVETAIWLMSRPVAMQSNLHNVLFVPHEGTFYVANASHGKPAAEMPYVRLDLNQLLNKTGQSPRVTVRSRR